MSISSTLRRIAERLDENATAIEFLRNANRSTLDQHAAVRAEIDKLPNVFADIKMYCNEMASISWLPDEVLANVFYHFVLICNPWKADWCHILLVCRRWKQVAMGSTELWTFITEEADEGRMCEWERRSKDRALSFKFTLTPTQQSHWIHDLFARNSHRIMSLEVRGLASQLRQFFGVDITAVPHLSGLKELSIEPLKSDPAMGVSIRINHPRWRSLRLLRLSGVCVENVAELRLSNLTHLVLELETTSSSSGPLSFPELLLVLRRSPFLQILSISGYMNAESADELISSTSSLDAIHLPHLQRLKFLGSPHNLTQRLIGALKIPPTTSIAISTSYTDKNISSIKNLVAPLCLHLRKSGAPVLRSMNIASINGFGFRIAFSDQSECSDVESAHIWVELRLSSHTDVHSHWAYRTMFQPSFRTALTKMIHSLPSNHEITHLDVVKIGNKRTFSTQTWSKLFLLLPRSLTIRLFLTNESTVPILNGFLDAMQSSALKDTPKKPKKPKIDMQECLRFIQMEIIHPKPFVVRRSNPPVFYPSSSIITNSYYRLRDFLLQYRDLDLKQKPKGEPVSTVCIENLQGLWQRETGGVISRILSPLADEFTWERKRDRILAKMSAADKS
ncbi:hypothetical protein VKT23_010350 [Stygiomarasmius scandens]|uniref:F-box domain-containing protein n=1 Tax=Marasmiellus scandens TaxID=2682957 RepID=A0ABR1JC18_9AGAR